MSTSTLSRDLDPTRVEAFAGRLLTTYTDSVVTLLIDLASRTGLLDALAAGGAPARSWPSAPAWSSATCASAWAGW